MQDSFGNIRYYGSDPNNYVTFNGEIAGWRIIGIFDTEDENGNVSKRIKLIRASSLGEFPFDVTSQEYTKQNSNIETSNNNTKNNKVKLLATADKIGRGDWEKADLNYELNSLFYNSITGICYTYNMNSITKNNCDFQKTGLTDEAKNQIEKVKYYLGKSTTTSDLYADDYYNSEKNVTSSSWIGYIGLMYSSDYAYASNLSNCTKFGNDYDKDTTNCSATNWLLGNKNIWTLSSSNSSTAPFIITNAGAIYTSGADAVYSSLNVYPVLYLDKNIQIIKGTGSKNNPYILL